MSTGSGFFTFLSGGFAQIFSQIVSIRANKLSNTNFVSSRHVTRGKASLPVDVRRSKTSLLKLPLVFGATATSIGRDVMICAILRMLLLTTLPSCFTGEKCLRMLCKKWHVIDFGQCHWLRGKNAREMLLR